MLHWLLVLRTRKWFVTSTRKDYFMLPPKWLYFLLVLVAFELLADILSKQFAITGKYVFAFLAILGFIIEEKVATRPTVGYDDYKCLHMGVCG